MSEYITAASAAANLARELVAADKMTRDDAIGFSNYIDRAVKLGELPDDAQMLGLLQSGEWKTANSSGVPVRAGRVISVGGLGISLDIFRPRNQKKKSAS